SEQVPRLFVDHVAMAMTIHVAQQYGEFRMRNPRMRGGLAPWRGGRVKELCEVNLNGGVNLTELATVCDLSVRHFTRAFKASTGMTAHQWLTTRRIERAKGLLGESSMSLAEIA